MERRQVPAIRRAARRLSRLSGVPPGTPSCSRLPRHRRVRACKGGNPFARASPRQGVTRALQAGNPFDAEGQRSGYQQRLVGATGGWRLSGGTGSRLKAAVRSAG